MSKAEKIAIGVGAVLLLLLLIPAPAKAAPSSFDSESELNKSILGALLEGFEEDISGFHDEGGQ